MRSMPDHEVSKLHPLNSVNVSKFILYVIMNVECLAGLLELSKNIFSTWSLLCIELTFYLRVLVCLYRVNNGSIVYMLRSFNFDSKKGN